MKVILLAILLSSISASAASSQSDQNTLTDLKEMERAAEYARVGSDLRFKQQRSNELSLTLVKEESIPAFAYRIESNWRYGEYFDDVFDCPRPGIMRMITAVKLISDSRTVPKFVQPGLAIQLHVRSKSLGVDMILEGASVLQEIKEIKTGAIPSWVFHVVYEDHVDSPLFSQLGPTGYLQVNPMRNGSYLNLDGGANLEGFDADLRPLIEHCAKSDPNYKEPPPTQEELAENEPIRVFLGPTENQAIAAILRNYRARSSIASGFLGVDDMVIGFSEFELHDCTITEDKVAFCNFNALLKLDSKKLGPAVAIANLGFAMAGEQWASFVVEGGQWELGRFYKDCTIRTTSINCTYLK